MSRKYSQSFIRMPLAAQRSPVGEPVLRHRSLSHLSSRVCILSMGSRMGKSIELFGAASVPFMPAAVSAETGHAYLSLPLIHIYLPAI